MTQYEDTMTEITVTIKEEINKTEEVDGDKS